MEYALIAPKPWEDRLSKRESIPPSENILPMPKSTLRLETTTSFAATPDISEMRAEFQQKVNARKEASAPTAAPAEPVQTPAAEQESKPSEGTNE